MTAILLKLTHFSMEDEYVEEGIKEQYSIRHDTVGVQQDRLSTGKGRSKSDPSQDTTPESTHLRRSTEGVGVEDGLYHDQGLSDVFPVQLVPVVSAFVRAVVEHLEELRSTKVEHELEEKGQIKLSHKHREVLPT